MVHLGWKSLEFRTQVPTVEKVSNAKQLPTVWYGRHMQAGVAEYHPDGAQPYRILVNEETIRAMDATFVGKPVYVHHVDEVDVANIQAEADGYVIDSFFNAADGCHWVKFLVVSDKGREAIKKGWRLSNAYVPKSFAQGGVSKGVEYQKEVMAAEYEHLAIVDNPRYENSIVLSPDDFKKFNEEKLSELKKLQNAKERRSMFDFFKRTKVENTDVAEMTVKLPKSGREVTIAQLINDADAPESQPTPVLGSPAHNEEKKDKAEEGEQKEKAPEEKKAEDKNPEEAEKQGDKEEHKDSAPQMANEDHHVAMKDGSTMSVKELRDRHDKMQDCMNTLAEMAKPKEEPKQNEDAGEKKAEKDEKAADKTENSLEDGLSMGQEHFEKLKNAPQKALEAHEVRLPFSGLERGRAKYGS